MTKQENIISIVSEAVEKAWEGSASAKEASEKYLVMLQQDDVLREEATRRHLERIAYLDVVAQPRGYRARLKRAAHQTVLSKGETSTPAVSLKNMAPAYAKDMFERWLLPNTGICLGDATSEDLEQAIMYLDGALEAPSIQKPKKVDKKISSTYSINKQLNNLNKLFIIVIS